MGEAAAGAGGASIVSLGLSAYSSVLKGEGTQAVDEAQADRAERAAQFGKVQANLTDTTMRERLNNTIGNIDVIRAAARIDPTSPTTAAIEDRQRTLSDRQRTAALTSINAQVEDDESSAKYLRQAGDFALDMGYLNAAIGVTGGIAKGANSGTTGGGG